MLVPFKKIGNYGAQTYKNEKFKLFHTIIRIEGTECFNAGRKKRTRPVLAEEFLNSEETTKRI